MKKELFDLLKQIVFVSGYYLGDVICRWLSGINEFPKYYWIITGLILVYRVLKDLKEIKDKIGEK